MEQAGPGTPSASCLCPQLQRNFQAEGRGWGRKPHTHTPALAQGLGIIISCYWQQLCNSP